MSLKTVDTIIDPVASDPGSPVQGQIWANSADDRFRFRHNSVTKALGEMPFNGNVITVDPNDPTADYSTIPLAITAAGDGDTILVGPGNYDVQLIIDTHVRIVGAGIHETILTGTLSSAGAIVSDSFGTEDPKVALEDLTIQMVWTGSTGTAYCVNMTGGQAGRKLLRNVRLIAATGVGASGGAIVGARMQGGTSSTAEAYFQHVFFEIDDGQSALSASNVVAARIVGSATPGAATYFLGCVFKDPPTNGNGYIEHGTGDRTWLVGCTVESGIDTSSGDTDSFKVVGSRIATYTGTRAAVDTQEFHANLDDEFAGLAEKSSPVNTDLLVIEDSAASYAKKRLQMVNLPGGVPSAHASTHQNGGSDEVATATPAANAIPKAGGAGTLAAGWIADGSDATAIHDNIAGEINAIAEKTTPVGTDLIVIEDSAASNAKKKVQVGNLPAPSPTSSIQEATTVTTTTSTSDVLMNSMTTTPASGTYLVWFSVSCGISSKTSNLYISIWSAGSQVAASERYIDGNLSQYEGPRSTIARVTVNGSQAIEGRWRVSGGTGSAWERQLMILKV